MESTRASGRILRSATHRLAAAAAAVALTATVASLAAPASAAGPAAGDELTYGTDILLQNQFTGDGGYLDTIGSLTQPSGATFDVATNQKPNSRGAKTSVWKVVSATGKVDGTPVNSGDVVYLVNQFGGGTYLDANGGSSKAGAKYDVSSTLSKDRAAGSGKWQIFGKASSYGDGHIRTADVVSLLNTYNYDGSSGGFLDANGASSQPGAKLDVSTSHYTDRGPGTGSWKVLPAA
ncbi:hypothetical protein [Streptomyces sp. NPDC008121]|uniref:hypothetical protein n=1 Tax=Streptomyces sp. NPDC008121 TaxID=3364809 RepID=UPI0036E3689B